jgi:hypothetical protein
MQLSVLRQQWRRQLPTYRSGFMLAQRRATKIFVRAWRKGCKMLSRFGGLLPTLAFGAVIGKVPLSLGGGGPN